LITPAAHPAMTDKNVCPTIVNNLPLIRP